MKENSTIKIVKYKEQTDRERDMALVNKQAMCL